MYRAAKEEAEPIIVKEKAKVENVFGEKSIMKYRYFCEKSIMKSQRRS